MEFAATKIGTGLPAQPFAGVVRSVFANSVILATDSILVTLVPESTGGLPFAISVDVPGDFDFTRVLSVGDAFATRAGVLRFRGRLSVDMQAARSWRSRLDQISVDFANPAAARAWHAVATALRDDGRSGAITRIASAAICSLGDATRCFDLPTTGHAAERLVGLGAGGTPAGDDVLVGYLAGIWSSVAQLPRRGNFAIHLGHLLRKLATRTNDVSRTYLEAASAGEVSERLTVLAQHMAAGTSTSATLAATRNAMSVGHTSGSDGTLGLLLGLAAWGSNPIFISGRHLVEQMSLTSA